jgi:hypothetical protein
MKKHGKENFVLTNNVQVEKFSFYFCGREGALLSDSLSLQSGQS